MNDAIAGSTEIYTQQGSAIAVFDGTANRALLVFGGEPGALAGFVDIEDGGGATEYLPFEGVTQRVGVCLERTTDALVVTIRRESGEHTSMTLQREVQPASPPPNHLEGVYRGYVHAYEEAGSIDVTVSEEGAVSCRVPGNCMVSGALSPTLHPERYDLAIQLSGSRRCVMSGRTVLGELIHFGKQMLAVCRTPSGGILYLGKRSDAAATAASATP